MECGIQPDEDRSVDMTMDERSLFDHFHPDFREIECSLFDHFHPDFRDAGQMKELSFLRSCGRGAIQFLASRVNYI
jgi:hypothetical protein